MNPDERSAVGEAIANSFAPDDPMVIDIAKQWTGKSRPEMYQLQHTANFLHQIERAGFSVVLTDDLHWATKTIDWAMDDPATCRTTRTRLQAALDRLVDAGLVQPNTEPEFSEDDVRLLASVMSDQSVPTPDDYLWVRAEKALRAGYRKVSP